MALRGGLRAEALVLLRVFTRPSRYSRPSVSRLAAPPAAVEVAAYRIVAEALANVVRHADASTVAVRLTAGAALEVEVCDDGVGIPLQTVAGVGLVSLRERAAELGGEVSVRCPVSLSSRTVMWPQGSRPTGCWTTAASGQAPANARM